MSETPQLRSITCQFPECTRPVRPSSGTGRRPSYCGLPDPHTGVVHNPKNAHLARNWSQREQAEPTLRALLADRDAAAEAPRPLSYAAVRLQDLVSDSLEEVRRAAARNDALLQVLQELAEPLRSADSARAELEAVRAEHAAELAAKNAELAQARQAVESARQAIDEAEAEAESDRAAVEPLEQQVSTLTAELEAAQTTLADQRARHQRDVEALNGQVSTLTRRSRRSRRSGVRTSG
jgi:colicin import membrane protein